MVSFDVVNCFESIPTETAIELIERDFHLIEEHTPIPREKFMEMLKICLHQANYFIYDDKFYKQKKGIFMGSSLAPVLVERVIEEIIDKSLEQLKINPDFWTTYVDDHLTSINPNEIDLLEKKLNSFDPNVQFTVEIQDMDTQSINFLDTTVYKIGTQLRTKWYHKPIASNRLLNFHSKHPRHMIQNPA